MESKVALTAFVMCTFFLCKSAAGLECYVCLLGVCKDPLAKTTCQPNQKCMTQLATQGKK